jgi:lysophospholipase L1-like esterase
MRTAIVSTLVSLLICELALRVLTPLPLIVPINEQFRGVSAPSPSTRSRIALPGQYDTTATINAEHFRMSRPAPRAVASGSTRVVMLGDSFTFGVGADDADSYPAVAERLLNARTAGRVDVVNAGVVGTGTGEQVLWYERWVSDFHPAIVVLNVFANDVDDDATRRLLVRQTDGALKEAVPARDAGGVRTGIRRSWPYRTLIAHSQLAALVRMTASRLDGSAGGPVATRDEFQTGLALQALEVARLNTGAAAGGAELVVVSIPAKETLDPGRATTDETRWKSEAIARSVAAACAAGHIPFIDLTAALREAGRSSPSPLYFAGDSHLTPAGYRVIAAAVAAFLDPAITRAGSARRESLPAGDAAAGRSPR